MFARLQNYFGLADGNLMVVGKMVFASAMRIRRCQKKKII